MVTAQTRQDSEKHSSSTFVCAPRSQQTDIEQARALFVRRAVSTSWTFGPIRGPLRAVQHLMSQKPAGFASFRRCQLAGGEVWGVGV